METYLTLLYVTLEQEIALKDFFASKGWMYFKPNLNVMTERVGPFENPTACKVATKCLASCNNSRYTEAIATSNVSQRAIVKPDGTSKVSSALVGKDVDESRVKIEISGVLDDNDSYMEENIDDGDNDDDFADSIHLDASVENNSTMHGYVNDTVNNTDICAVSKVDVLEHSNTNFPNTNDVDVDNTLVMTGDKKNYAGGNSSNVLKKDSNLKNTVVLDKKHIQFIVLKALKSSTTGKESSKDDFCICPQCEKSVRNTGIRRHLLGHLNLPHKCGRCTIYFNTAAELEAHKVSKHMGEYICSYCGMKYRHRNSLNEHIQKQHEGTAKVFECEICGVRMCRQRHLDDHMNTHKNLNPYTCSKCGKSYKNKCAYKRHSKNCGSSVKHACEQCGQLYTTTLGLRDHIKRCHEGRYDFRCVCGVDFKTRSARCRHRQYCEAFQLTKNSINNRNGSVNKNNGVVVESILHGDDAAISYNNIMQEVSSNDVNIDDKNQEMINVDSTNVEVDINTENGYDSQHVHVGNAFEDNMQGEFVHHGGDLIRQSADTMISNQ